MQNDLVVESWGVITGFLASAGLLDRVGPPASPLDLRTAAEVAGPLPAELARWWSLSSGASLTLIPPAHTPYAVADALALRAALASGSDSSPAGTPWKGSWLPWWMPIADGGLFADLRPGAARGCVGRLRAGQVFDGPRWLGVGAMLADMADAIRDDVPVDGLRIRATPAGVTWEDEAAHQVRTGR
nr:hypothetical protein [uncultured Actinoplanes sp.]